MNKQQSINKQETVDKQGIINKLESIESLIDKYGGVIGKLSNDARNGVDMVSAEVLKETIEGIDKENRLLTIGIIGRVKAGKSSMLNSVFFEGKSVLPKAATPMTASLTEMTYGESYSLTVQYYTAGDIEKIKKFHDEYVKQLNEKKQSFSDEQKEEKGQEDEEKAKRRAEAKMQEAEILSASFEQYRLMQKSGKLDEMRRENKPDKTIEFKSPDELKDELQKYVGHDGAMMPFTRNVIICMPEPSLKDISVVDTPGLNDPVVSRSRRTDEYLGKCDVVFIVSPAGQFLSAEDQCLTDRLSSKEGISQLYWVASQSDSQLHDSIGEESDWQLDKALIAVQSDLASQMASVLKGLKEKKSIGDQFDQLIDESQERMIIISAMCHDLYLRYENKKNWDGDMNHVWKMLKGHYGDYFDTDLSARQSLKSISNIEKIDEKIEQVRSRKEEIIRKKQGDYLSQQDKNVEAFRQQLIKDIDEDIKQVEDSDIEKIKEDRKKLQKDKGFFDEADSIFEESLKDFLDDQKSKIRAAEKELFSEVDEKMEQLPDTKTRSSREKKKGVISWFKRLFGAESGYETKTWEVEIIRISAMENVLKKYKNRLVDLPEEIGFKQAMNAWRDSAYEKICNCIDAANTNDIITSMFIKAFRNMINKTEIPDIDLKISDFSYWRKGTIEGEDNIEEFFDEVNEWRSECRDSYKKSTNEFIKTTEQAIKKERYILPDMDEQIKDLEEKLKNKEQTIERLKTARKALKEI